MKKLLFVLLIVSLFCFLGFKKQLLPSPVSNGRVTSKFEKRINPITNREEFHTATDIAAAYGSVVLASFDCEVTFVGSDEINGENVKVRAEDVIYRYCHLSDTNVKVGYKLKKGEIIGYVGNSGYATGAHLHLEVIKNGEYINPETVFDLK